MRFNKHVSGDIWVILTKEELLDKAPKYYLDMDSADLNEYDEFAIVDDGWLYGINSNGSKTRLLDGGAYLREVLYQLLDQD